MSGLVLHNIAEGIMAHNISMDISSVCDDKESLRPMSLNGNLEASRTVLNHLGFLTSREWTDSGSSSPFWGVVGMTPREYTLSQRRQTPKDKVPDVKGMGARDAVYQMEMRGLRTRVEGRGKVVAQSIAPGDNVTKGATCLLTLQYK